MLAYHDRGDIQPGDDPDFIYQNGGRKKFEPGSIGDNYLIAAKGR